MKRQTLWLFFTGALLMVLPLFIKSFRTSDLVPDFIKGIGVGMIIGAFFLGLKRSKNRIN